MIVFNDGGIYYSELIEDDNYYLKEFPDKVKIQFANDSDFALKYIEFLKNKISEFHIVYDELGNPLTLEEGYTDEEIYTMERTEYENLSIKYIREKYTVNDECKILRQYLSDVNNESYSEEFNEYNRYVENCKLRAKKERGII